MTVIKRILLVVTFCFAIAEAQADSCLQNQGALDFGSGTIKAVVASVNVCEKKIADIIFEERFPLALNEALEKSSDQQIPLAIITAEVPKLQSLIQKMRTDYKAAKIAGVATSVYRIARNGTEIVKHLSTKLRIPIDVISQKKEAQLGYWSAAGKKNLTPKDESIIWDIGGGSMQMYSREGGKEHMFEGDLASVTFKNMILKTIQFKDPKNHASPNPIGNGWRSAVQLAKNHAYLKVPVFFKKQASKKRIIGVGAVLSLSVQKQVKDDSAEFSRQALEQQLLKRAFLKDSDIESSYRNTDISNLALVLAYMQALNIPKVETVPTSLGHGLIYYNLIHD